MIISKKRFEEEIRKRMYEEDFKRRISEELSSLEEDVRDLRFRVSCLEAEDCMETDCKEAP